MKALNGATASRFATFDGLRGLAALAVVLGHSSSYWAPISLHQGDRAVDLFFALSGFVIAHAYQKRLAGGMSVPRFFSARLQRLYPLYLVGTLLAILSEVAAMFLGANHTLPLSTFVVSSLLALLFLPTPGGPPDGNIFPLNYPSWSLIFELFINVVYAMALPRLSNRVVTALVLTSGMLMGATIMAFGTSNVGPIWSNFPAGFIRVTFSFFLGVLMQRRWTGSKPGFVIPIFTVALTALFLAVSPDDRRLTDAAFLFIALPIIVFTAAKWEPSGAIRKVFVFLGAISYPIYVIHAAIITLMARAMTLALGKQPIDLAPISGVLLFAALIAGGYLLARLDATLQRRLKRDPARPTRPL